MKQLIKDFYVGQPHMDALDDLTAHWDISTAQAWDHMLGSLVESIVLQEYLCQDADTLRQDADWGTECKGYRMFVKMSPEAWSSVLDQCSKSSLKMSAVLRRLIAWHWLEIHATI